MQNMSSNACNSLRSLMPYHIKIFTASMLILGTDGSGVWKAVGLCWDGSGQTVFVQVQMAPGDVRTAPDGF